VTSAELWAESRDNARALDAIEELHAGGARHIHAARIALTAHLHAGRWHDVLRGVRLLSKRRALHDAAARRLKLIAYRELLLARRHDAAALEAAFEEIDSDDRRLPEVALLAARLLNVVGRGRIAAQVLEQALEVEWNERLLDEYARAQSFPARERIERAEGWLQRHPQSPGLLRCLGELCLREQLWGKARVYLEESLRLQVHPATYLALARLAEMTGQNAEAAQHYREAALGLANVVSESAPDLQRVSAAALARDPAASALLL
jgi:HemY protein